MLAASWHPHSSLTAMLRKSLPTRLTAPFQLRTHIPRDEAMHSTMGVWACVCVCVCSQDKCRLCAPRITTKSSKQQQEQEPCLGCQRRAQRPPRAALCPQHQELMRNTETSPRFGRPSFPGTLSKELSTPETSPATPEHRPSAHCRGRVCPGLQALLSTREGNTFTQWRGSGLEH